MNWQSVRDRKRPAILVAVLLLCLALVASVRGCRDEVSPIPLLPSASPPAQPAASPTPPPPPLVTAMASTDVRIFIRRKPIPQASGSLLYGPPYEETIEIVATQIATVSAPVVVVTPAPTPPPAALTAARTSMAPDGGSHSRLGVMAGIVPGVFALDVQALRGRPLLPAAGLLPHQLAHLELSLDVELNHLQAGALVAAGDKIFVGAGAYAAYDGRTGYFIGAGMRF